MKSIWEIPFIVVDIETSGSNPKDNNITEIACVTSIGGEVVNIYSSLVNPHELIPPFISKMTGITDLMVSQAPELSDIMPQILKIFSEKDAVFVAHNARFDWSFISESFRKTGIKVPSIPRLCTLKLSRRLLPKRVKKNLGELSEYFGIEVKNRHRAHGDATATTHVLNDMLEMAENEHDIHSPEQLLVFQDKRIRNFRAPKVTEKRLESSLSDLPDTPGVFKFLDINNIVHYIGYSKSLRQHVNAYFNHEIMLSKRIGEMIDNSHVIEWEATSSELSALFMYKRLTHSLKPTYNNIDSLYKHKPLLRLTKNSPYPLLEITFKQTTDGALYYGPYKDVALAYHILQTVESKFKIRKCSGAIAPSDTNTPCFHYHEKVCDAPCVGYVSNDAYNEEILKVEQFLQTYPSGPVNQLEKQIDNVTTNLGNEKTARLKKGMIELRARLDRKYNGNMIDNNLIYIRQQSVQEKTLELFIFQNKSKIYQTILGRKSSLDELLTKISECFFSPIEFDIKNDATDSADLHILRTYLKRHHNNGILLYPRKQSESTFLNNVIDTIRNFQFDTLEAEIE